MLGPHQTGRGSSASPVSPALGVGVTEGLRAAGAGWSVAEGSLGQREGEVLAALGPGAPPLLAPEVAVSRGRWPLLVPQDETTQTGLGAGSAETRGNMSGWAQLFLQEVCFFSYSVNFVLSWSPELCQCLSVGRAAAAWLPT